MHLQVYKQTHIHTGTSPVTTTLLQVLNHIYIYIYIYIYSPCMFVCQWRHSKQTSLSVVWRHRPAAHINPPVFVFALLPLLSVCLWNRLKKTLTADSLSVWLSIFIRCMVKCTSWVSTTGNTHNTLYMERSTSVSVNYKKKFLQDYLSSAWALNTHTHAH